jgi:tetratricopeptide (TPR) repeat protein
VNRFFPFALIISLVPGIILPSQSVIALESSEIAAKAKEFTVQIDGEESGTGTIIEHQGNTYTVITCWHVLDTPGNYQIITPDGQQYQGTGIKNLPNADLAVIEFTSNQAYPTAKLGNSQAIIPGTSTYVVGYPDPIPGIPERAYIFLNADVVSQLSQGEKGYTIIHDNPSTPGGSGGGIFDVNGSLIGINGKFISDANTTKVYGAGIPLQFYLATRSDLVVPTNITPPQDFVSVGKRKLKANDYQGAIAEFSQALASNPNDIDALSQRATSYFSLGEYDKAIADNTEVIRLNPKDVKTYVTRSITYLLLEEYDKTISDLNEVIRLNPEFAEAYNMRGVSYNLLGEYDKAIADYTEAIRLNPELAQTYGVRGRSYNNLGEYDKAIADFNEAIRLNPEDADAYYNRGLVYGKLEEYDKEISDYTEAIRLDPQNANAYNNRGYSYYKLEEYQKAITDYTEAIRLNPEYALAYANRSISYGKLEEYQKAIADAQQAANLYQQQGDTENYQKALSFIEGIEELK